MKVTKPQHALMPVIYIASCDRNEAVVDAIRRDHPIGVRHGSCSVESFKAQPLLRLGPRHGSAWALVKRGDSYRAHGGAFTLIELLVVIAVIAVLFSLLLPSVREAQETAKTAVCLSQIRSLGLLMHSYARDSNDVLPIYAKGSVNDQAAFGSDYWFHYIGWPTRMVYLELLDRVVKPNFYQRSLRVCPSVKNDGTNPHNFGDAAPQDFTNYDMDIHVSGFRDFDLPLAGGYGFIRVGEINKPTSVFLLAETATYRDLNQMYNTGGVNVVATTQARPWMLGGNFVGQWPDPTEQSQLIDMRHHGTRTNFVFVDGHAQSIEFQGLSYVEPFGEIYFSHWNTPVFKVW